MDPLIPTDLITPDEAAALVRVHKNAVRRWLITRKLAGYRVGGRWRISRADLAAFVERRDAEPQPPERPLPLNRTELRARDLELKARLRELGIG